MTRHGWDEMEVERLNPLVTRQAIHAERLTIARLELAAGAVVPRHSHPNEQVTVLQSGRLRFEFDDAQIEITGGQLMEIPGGEPHAVVALEDSVAVDVFAPVREDWKRGDDAYLRR